MFFLKNTIRTALDFLYPGYCSGCMRKVPAGLFCSGCAGRIEPVTEVFSPHFFAAVRYRPPFVNAICDFKYRGKFFLASGLNRYLAELFRRRNFAAETVGLFPVPLYPARRRERGYNQAELLARHLAAEFSLPVFNRCLIRARNTASQTGLSGKARQNNVAGVFKVRDPRPVVDRTCLLIDDVFTTGATLNNCRSALLSAGAAEVFGLVLARD